MYEETRGRKEIKLREFPVLEKAKHIRLIKGVYSDNPHVRILCPTLLIGGCRKKESGHQSPLARPRARGKKDNGFI